MYITLDNEEYEISKMTISFVVNALKRYNALSSATNITIEERKEIKSTRDALKAEYTYRKRLRFVPCGD